MHGDDAPLDRLKQQMQSQIDELRRELQELRQQLQGRQ